MNELDKLEKRSTDPLTPEQEAIRQSIPVVSQAGLPGNFAAVPSERPLPIHQRVWDLLRQMRHKLLDDDLISREEYAWLLADAPNVSGGGSPAPRRLETYDQHEARRHEAETSLTAAHEREAALREGIDTALNITGYDDAGRLGELGDVIRQRDQYRLAEAALRCERDALREENARLTTLDEELRKDALYHADCRPNRKQAEQAMADAVVTNDKWANEVVARRKAEADVARLTRELAETVAALREENTDWILVADGIKHDWRCGLAGDTRWTCLRCERDQLRQERAAADESARLLQDRLQRVVDGSTAERQKIAALREWAVRHAANAGERASQLEKLPGNEGLAALFSQEQATLEKVAIHIDLMALTAAESTQEQRQEGCERFAPPEWTDHWREWHRGHGCNLDPDATPPQGARRAGRWAK